MVGNNLGHPFLLYDVWIHGQQIPLEMDWIGELFEVLQGGLEVFGFIIDRIITMKGLGRDPAKLINYFNQPWEFILNGTNRCFLGTLLYRFHNPPEKGINIKKIKIFINNTNLEKVGIGNKICLVSDLRKFINVLPKDFNGILLGLVSRNFFSKFGFT